MKRLGLSLLASVGLATLAQAADLPTKKAPAPAPAPNCYASFWSWLNSSASDCPLSAYGITFYGTLDVNYGYEEWGAPRSSSADKLQYGIRSNAYEHIWQAGYNGLSTSVLGLKMKEDLAPIGLAGWSLVGVLEAGINPYTGTFFNGPRSLADVNTTNNSGLVTINGKNFYFQNQKTNLDSSRAGQWDNSQGYLGISSPTWGTLTFGRTNSLTYDTMAGYDPMAGSPAFSLIGFSSSFPGYGDTEIVRINTALTYKLAIQNVAGIFNTVRLAGQAQIGGYGVGNGAMDHYEGQVGFDWGNFSFDGIFAWAKDAVSLSTFNGGNLGQCAPLIGATDPFFTKVNGVCYNPNDVLKATLANIFGTELMASYKWDRFKFYGGYIYSRSSNPSDDFSGGFQTMYPGIFVPPTSVTSGPYLLSNNTLNTPGFAINKVLQTWWTGAKYSVPDDWLHGWGALDLAAGFYYQTQNDYNFGWTTGNIKHVPYGYAAAAACTGTGAFISSGKCSGSQDGIAFLADWRPVKRVDIYAGVMLTNVYGGLANGFFQVIPIANGKTIINSQEAHTQSYDPTIGIRIRF
jgi:predicted porin